MKNYYAWMIVFVAFTTHVIIDGICFSVGIFMIEFLDYFEESNAKISLVGSIMNGMYLSVGPIAGALAKRFGCRAVTIVGSLISTISFVAAANSSSVEVLIVTYGIMAGFGFGLMYLPPTIMVGYYFDKHRALATGIAVCGSGIGAFVFAQLCYFLLEHYSWKGATWIIGGITLHMVPIGALLRPLYNEKRKTIKTIQNNSEHNDPVNDLYRCSVNTVYDTVVYSTTEKESDSLGKIYQENDGCIIEDNKNILTCKYNIESNTGYADSNNSNRLRAVNITTNVQADSKVTVISKFFSGFELLKNPVFLVYGISCFVGTCGLFIPFFFLPDYAIKRGLSGDKSAFLISIVGIVNTINRILCGFISDLKWVDCLLLNNLVLIITGAATMLCPLYYNFELLAMFCVIFGCGIGVFISLRSIVVIELLGLDHLTNAFGLVVMFQGIAAFISAPIAGSVYDRTNNYSYVFYMAGGAFVLSGLINLPLRRIDAYIKRKKRKRLKSVSSRLFILTSVKSDSEQQDEILKNCKC